MGRLFHGQSSNRPDTPTKPCQEPTVTTARLTVLTCESAGKYSTLLTADSRWPMFAFVRVSWLNRCPQNCFTLLSAYQPSRASGESQTRLHQQPKRKTAPKCASAQTMLQTCC